MASDEQAQDATGTVGDVRPALTLRGQRGSVAGRTFEINADGASLGRAAECQIAVDPSVDSRVSGRHASLALEGGTWVFRDVGSTNGSLVNGRPTPPQVAIPLQNGSVIELGEDREEGTVAFQVVGLVTGNESQKSDLIEFSCAKCGAPLSAARAMIGKRIDCSTCGTASEIPIRAKVFNTPGSGGRADGADRRLPPPPPPVPQQGGHLIGKMKGAIRGFKEKRELQSELTRLEKQLSTLQSQMHKEAGAFGRAAWGKARAVCEQTQPGQGIAERESATEPLRAALSDAESRSERAIQELSTASDRWKAQIVESESELERAEAEQTALRNEVEAAEARLRDAAVECITDTAESFGRLQRLAREGLDEPGLRDRIHQALADLRRSAQESESKIESLDDVETTHRDAVSEHDTATESAANARARLDSLRSESRDELSQLDAGRKEAEQQLTEARAALRSAEAELEPVFVVLGELLLRNGGDGLPDDVGEEKTRAGEAAARFVEASVRAREIRDRLEDMR